MNVFEAPKIKHDCKSARGLLNALEVIVSGGEYEADIYTLHTALSLLEKKQDEQNERI